MVTEHKMGLFITTSGQVQHSLDLTKHVTTSLDKYTVSDLTTHTHCHANNLKALNKRQKLNQNKISFSLIFHRFSPFICCVLSVVLWLDKGDFPEKLHTVCSCQNKQAFV